MLQAFVIVLREGFEAFLIVSVIVSYLQKIGRHSLLPAAGWGTGTAVAASVALGWLLEQRGVDPLWEGILGVVAVVLVSSLVIQMWKHARYLKQETEARLQVLAAKPSSGWAAGGIFLFTGLMVAREGVEAALLLIQVRQPTFLLGAALGLLCTGLLAWLWVRCSHLINLALFFQVTSVFLLLFLAQVGISAFHELTEAGVLPHSAALHAATEPFSSDGRYGQWFSIATVVFCAGWLLLAWGRQRLRRAPAAPR